LKKTYEKAFKTDEIGNIATFLIGSAAGAFSSSAMFPLEVVCKQMQVGAVGGRQVYNNMLHALMSILREGRNLGASQRVGPELHEVGDCSRDIIHVLRGLQEDTDR